MRYGSVCSGIEAATAAWHHMGWEPAFFSEIEKFPRAVLEHHYPEVPLHGDFTTIEQNQYGKIDLLVGGTPCQSFSVAGLRGGLDDDRGNLALEFCRLAQREQPRWIVWENVPGVLSSGGGRDFGSILGALEDLGYGLAYRVLDAQYFGVAQRRRRVFVVGYLGDWRPAAAVLFERHSMSGHPAPSREARKEAARAAPAGAGGSGAGGGGRSGVATFECGGIGSYSSSSSSSPLLRTGADGGPGCEALVAFAPAVANAITASMANAATGHNKDENVIAFDVYNQSETPQVSKTVAARNDQDTASCIAFDTCDSLIAQPVAFEWQRGATQNMDFTTEISPALIKSQTPAVVTVGALSCNTGPNGHDAGNFACNQAVDAGHLIPVHVATHEVAGTLKACAGTSGGWSNSIDHAAAGYMALTQMPAVAFAIQAGALRENPNSGPDGVGVQADHAYTVEARAEVQAVAFQSSQSGVRVGRVHATLDSNNGSRRHNGVLQPYSDMRPLVAFAQNQRDEVRTMDVAGALAAEPGTKQQTYLAQPFSIIAETWAVRRLTPTECERLQGFPDNYTAIPWRGKSAADCPDGPRYKALGNSMAVPVMRWIGERIQLVDDFITLF